MSYLDTVAGLVAVWQANPEDERTNKMAATAIAQLTPEDVAEILFGYQNLKTENEQLKLEIQALKDPKNRFRTVG